MDICLRHSSILFLIFGLFLTGCGNSYQSRIDEYSSLLSEEARCETSTSYSPAVNLVGTASFEKRTIELTTETSGSPSTTILKTMALGNPLPAALPIQFAEVIVYNSVNARVQCGMTDASGNIKAVDGVSALKIPNTKGAYKVKIISRSVHPTYATYISIKKDKYRNEVHSINANFNVTAASTVSVNLMAHARQTVSDGLEAGAFNIMNSIQTAFDYVKVNTPLVNTSCMTEKLNVYWKPGFNPVQYQSPSADPQTLVNTSYYLATTKELFITGGQLGDTSLTNTDHFDDFAIMHELGHFIEDHCGQWVSPGGNHTLTARIDQRLAWSEGWANYFAANVIHDRASSLDSTLMGKLENLTENASPNLGWTYFFNSYGFSDSAQNIGNGEGFVIDFKRSGSDPGAYQFAPYSGQEFDKVNPAAYKGEGHTREGAISRGLFKLTNFCGAHCAASPFSFEDVWKSFDRLTGVALENNPYIGSHKILEKLKVTTGSWTTGVGGQKTVADSEALQLVSENAFGTSPLIWAGYGEKLVTGSSCTLSIQPRIDGPLNNSSSDQRYSNHFYSIDFASLPSVTRIDVTFTKVPGGSNVDHDLILFKPGYFFNDDYSCGAYTNGTCTSFIPNRNSTSEDIFVMDRAPASTISSTYTKSIDLTGIDRTQKYLLDIRTWTAGLSISGLTEYSYVISSNSVLLCPQ